jgi:hypothetical protein
MPSMYVNVWDSGLGTAAPQARGCLGQFDRFRTKVKGRRATEPSAARLLQSAYRQLSGLVFVAAIGSSIAGASG